MRFVLRISLIVLLASHWLPAPAARAEACARSDIVGYNGESGVLTVQSAPEVGLAIDDSGLVTITANDSVAVCDLGVWNAIRRIEHTGPVLTLGNVRRFGPVTIASDGQIVVAGRLQSPSVQMHGERVTVVGAVAAEDLRVVARDTAEFRSTASIVLKRGMDGGTAELRGHLLVTGASVDAAGATGGTISLDAASVLHHGRIEAGGSVGNGGRIAVAFTDRFEAVEASTMRADGREAGGQVTVSGGGTGRLLSSGQHSASGRTGGEITLNANAVSLVGARVESEGDLAGGTITVGSARASDVIFAARTTLVSPSSRLSVSSLKGQGGQVLVWSDDETTVQGRVEARGGSGGGFVEVSGKSNLALSSAPDVSASDGTPGSILLDPKNVTVNTASGIFPQFQLVKTGSSADDFFGQSIMPLSTGNVVVTAPQEDPAPGQTDRGAVYLYNGTTGALVSKVVGRTNGDQAGSISSSTVAALTGNGNYVIFSPQWKGGAGGTEADAGAWTWGSGVSGINGVISSANSYVGSNAGDSSSAETHRLTNGNYVVSAYNWKNGANPGAGAVLLGNGATGSSGAIATTNSLHGTASNDQVGLTVKPLTNGNYAVGSPQWDGAGSDRGAATLCFGATGSVNCTNVIPGAGNSLIGAANSDNVGGTIIPLPNGHYVVQSPNWNGGGSTRGAVTLADGTTRSPVGTVTTLNSLYGTSNGDSVGSQVLPLIGGVNKYVVQSPNWNGARGAATLCNGVPGAANDCDNVAVAGGNSLTGANPNDFIGNVAVALTNGNYVVSSTGWDNGGIADAGAATWCNGSTNSCAGLTPSAANSIVGDHVNDYVGDGMVALTNGNFVVRNGAWFSQRGAATWGNGTTGVMMTGAFGVVTSTNSIVGNAVGDTVGNGGIVALTDGNYIVGAPSWNGDRGAVMWGNGATGTAGNVNSLTGFKGTAANQRVGSASVRPLPNGNYIVRSPQWEPAGGVLTDIGAVTWRAAGSASGTPSAANSLIGSQDGDVIGSGFGGVDVLSDGNYLALSNQYQNGPLAAAGAVTWISGSTGKTLNGNNTIDSGNSIIGQIAMAVPFPPKENTANGTLLMGFRDELPGKVIIFAADPNKVTYGFGSAQVNNLTIQPAALEHMLNLGSQVTIQASNDITISTAIAGNNGGGNGGHQTYQAGRSVLIQESIGTDGGNLTIIANDTLANGVIDAQRDPGLASILMSSGTQLSAGTGNVTIDVRNGAGKTNSGAGIISLRLVFANTLTIPAGPGSVLLNNGMNFANGLTIGRLTSLVAPVTINSPAGTLNFAGGLNVGSHTATFFSPNAIQLGGSSSLNGGSMFAASGFNVSGGGIGGVGTMNGNVTIASPASIEPGLSPGTLTIEGNLTLQTGSTYVVEILGTDPGDYDTIVVNGQVNLGGATLDIKIGGPLAAGTTFTIVANDAADPVAGTFAGLPQNGIVTVGAQEFVITYSGGTGNDVVLTSGIAPIVTTTVATGVGLNTATLNAVVNARGGSATTSFEWGTDSSNLTNVLGASPSPATGIADTAISGNLAGLSPNTTYYFRGKAAGSGGTTLGSILSFTTLPDPNVTPPSAVTLDATAVTSTTATLNGTANANGTTTQVFFEYGTASGSYNTMVPASPAQATGTSDTAVGLALVGLLPNTTYFFRTRATNPGGTQVGNEKSFTTAVDPSVPPPTAVRLSATGVTSVTAVLNGTVNPNGSVTTVSFEYGTQSTGFNKSIVLTGTLSGIIALPVIASPGGLPPLTTHLWRIRASNAGGTVVTDEGIFTTLAPPAGVLFYRTTLPVSLHLRNVE